MAYATVDDVQARMTREMTDAEKTACSTLLDDAAAMIDAIAKSASDDVKKIVSCRVVSRSIGSGEYSGLPAGVTQGSMSGLGYSQSWTLGSGGGLGELYLSKADRAILGVGNQIGSHSPVEDIETGGLPW